ncbi:ABC transporter substrate binding protein [Clostridium sp. D53t1_180928_C8]|uniref:ABC transporter substrate-binding protein n=1 Tax=Clostridium sp. D53t1_180928_C8 TaxID=2787101 RepID=UPI001FAC6E32|nr:ABC transporter substrate binding protein [Clostridium sp. D53t1_180928_C8]
MRKLRGIILGLIFIMYTFILNNNYVYAEVNENDKIEVLFISSFNSDFISFNDQVEGLKSGLDNNCNINIEYMNFKIFDSYESEENFFNLLKYKLETYENIDVIIAGDDEAAEFCLKYRDDLFKGVPISFLGVQDYVRRERALEYDLVSGVTEVESIRENIELIKKLHPNVDTINFIDSFGINLYDEILSEYEEFNINWIITNDIPINEVKNILCELDKNDVVIKLYVNNFSDNNYLGVKEIDKIINEGCNNIPIYNILNYDIGQGSVGGKVINHFNQGKKAGEIAIGLLNGESNEDIYIKDDSANEYIFDYKALRKFGIKTSDLPVSSKIINNPIDVIREYKNIIISNILLLLSLVVIIITLICYIRRKRIYEKEILKAMNTAEEANRVKS